jgi:hypothetical protein
VNRRSFFSTLGKGAVAVAAVAVLPGADVAAAPPAKLTDIVPPPPTGEPAAGTRHFAVLMGYDGQAIKTMMIDNLPQEIHLEWGASGTQKERSEFRLVSKDIYDGRTIEGLARYIMWKGPQPPWPVVKLGF